ncbi:MAG: glutathione S-transferase family protein [Cyanobacteria bacterium]|jgi:glutathione S-transferase|nr:glutathione S-transferase family protein [Cyanobacteria bacterium GSL.Bin1]
MTLELYSASVCPFAHRTRLTLMEKGIDFQLIEIDLNNKPDWFSEVSPYGKVPVIKHQENRIWESAIINEYLDEAFPEPALLPESPGERALARIWIDFANTKLVPVFYKMLLEQNPEKQTKWKTQFQEQLQFIEKEGMQKLSSNGKYWLGNRLSLVDLTFYPWFERFCILEHYRDVFLPSSCSFLQHWWEEMSQRESVQQIKNARELYIAQYEKYANNTVSGITAQEMRDS